MIKNIIFDIGNVLTDYRWEDFLKDQGFDDAMVARIAKATVLHPLWSEFDRGEWDLVKLYDAFVALDPEIEQEIRSAYASLHGLIGRRDYAIPWVEAFKAKGYKVYYLSNFSDKAYKDCAEAIDFLPHMDGGILSYHEFVTKPNPGIYQLLIEKYQLVPEECVFLDDMPCNIEAAKACGLGGIVFETKEQVERDLAALGVTL